MKYMIIAGEASGDLHASHLMTSLKKFDSEATFVFLGGDMMTTVAGHDPVVHIRDMAFMGFSEVLRNLSAIKRNIRTAKNILKLERPDALILVDYPGFNLKIAKEAKKNGIKVFYYISPKVWAWKEHRVKTIKRLVDKMFVIFPFEVDFFASRHDYHVEFVGNPTVAEVKNSIDNREDKDAFLERNKLRNRPIIALLPGSRLGEIRNNLKVMAKVCERFPQYRGVIAGAPGVPKEYYRRFTDLPVVFGDTMTLLSYSTAALVTSGTATLETALIGTPQVACYRSNGRRIAYEVMKRVLKVKFVTLPNLIVGKEIIPEMLLHMCTPEAISNKLIPLLQPTEARDEMVKGYHQIQEKLAAPGSAADNTAKGIIMSTRL